MSNKSVTLSLHPWACNQTDTQIALGLFKTMSGQISRFYALQFARRLRTESVQFGTESVFLTLKAARANGLIPSWLVAEFDEPGDENMWEARARRQDAWQKLLKDGAAGNTEAAIAYCKAELAGEIGHGAWA